MRVFVQDTLVKREAGGVLLGRFVSESDDVIIDAVTIPQQGDKRRRFRFFRKQYLHQRLIDKAWRETEGTCNYLGEWHTHPESRPTPSSIDCTSWAKQTQSAKYQGDSLFFIILGTSSLRLFEMNKGENIIHVLSPISKVDDEKQYDE